jgi:hypothetical protein
VYVVYFDGQWRQRFSRGGWGNGQFAKGSAQLLDGAINEVSMFGPCRWSDIALPHAHEDSPENPSAYLLGDVV